MTWVSTNTNTVFFKTITSSASSNTKGSWTEVFSSLSVNADSLVLNVLAGDGAGKTYLLDIGTGGAGSESVLIGNIPVAVGDNGRSANGVIRIPVKIASGTRIAMRVQANTGSLSLYLNLMATDAGVPTVSAFTSATTYGADTATSRGSKIVAVSNTANTKGVYTEITASTTDTITYLLAFFTGIGERNTIQRVWSVDISTGASSSETVVIPDIALAEDTAGDQFYPWAIGFPITIASGTRIAARQAIDGTGVTSDRDFELVLVGLNLTTSGGSSVSGYSRSRVVNR